MGGEGWDFEPEFDPDCCEPDDYDFALMRYLALLPGPDDHEYGHYADPEIERLARQFDYDADELHELFRAVLFLRGWRLGQRVLWPQEAIDPVRVLLVLLAAARCGSGHGLHLAPDGADLTRVQAAPLTHARATLTAAPPARVPAPAGTAG